MKKKLSFILLSLTLCLAGCSNTGSASTPASTPVEATASPEASAPANSEEPIESEPALVLPLVENTSGKVQIQTVSGSSTYPYNSYIITSTNGESIVLDPTSMPPKDVVDIKPAAIISTHSHPDHTDSYFTKSNDCPHFTSEVTSLDTTSFKIFTIASSHSGDTIDDFPSNVLTVADVDGLRIVHMGDIGQTTLTDEQLKALGHVDIAFMQFDNSYSDMSLENEKGFKLMEQLKPTIIIPTHYTDDALPIFEQKYGKIQEFDNVLTISKDDLLATSVNMYRILNTHVYQ